MIRETLLISIILGLAAYAWRDWYKSLCGLIVLMAIIRHEIMPEKLFGIPGLNPWNFILANTLVAFFLARKREGLTWDMPRKVTFLLFFWFLLVNISMLRTDTHIGIVTEFARYVGFHYTINSKYMYVNYLFTPIKWMIPSALLFMGCRTTERLRWAIGSMLLMYFILSVLVIRWVPPWLVVNGEELNRRAARVLGRYIGYYRTDLSIMLAGGCWIAIAAANYMRKYALMLLGLAGIVFMGMLLTGGRAGWGAFFALGLIVAFAKYRKYLILAPIVAVLAMPLIPDAVWERMGQGIDTKEVDSDSKGHDVSQETKEMDQLTSGRSLLWPMVIQRIEESPVVGYGFYGIVVSGASREYWDKYRYPYLHPHNAYLQQLLDNGVVGLLPLLLLFSLFLRYAWRLFRSTNPEESLAGATGFCGVFVFMLGGLSGQSFYAEERAFGMWCGIGIMLSYYSMRQRHGVPGKVPDQADVKPEQGARFENALWNSRRGILPRGTAQRRIANQPRWR